MTHLPSEKPTPSSSSIVQFFISRFRLTAVVILAIIFLGINAYIKIPLESTPEIKVPVGVVSVVFPGASAEDIENLITNEIEKEIKGLDDLDYFTSSSSEGIASMTVNFVADADIPESIRKLKDAIDQAKPRLPEDAEDPVVTEISFSDTPVITFSLVGNFTYTELAAMAEIVQDELEKVPGISEARILGERKKRINIYAKREVLEGLNVSLDDIGVALQRFHVDLPLGEIVTDSFKYQIRFQGKAKTAEDIAKIPVITHGTTSILIGDIAEVKEELTPETVYNRISLNGDLPEQSISLSVFKKSSANLLEAVDAAKIRILELPGKELPSADEGLAIEITNDNSEFTREDFYSLANSAIQTVILIFITLFLALGIKEALIASISIPLTFLCTFIVFQVTGNSLNNITLFGLVLGLGLLVDTSIVIMEGIFENIHQRKLSSVQAALKTIDTYKWPLISGTMTTVAAFVPMYLMSGVTGQFFSYIPTTVTAVLISSLCISLFIAPAIAAKLIRGHDQEIPKPSLLTIWREKLLGIMNGFYTSLLDQLLEHPHLRRFLVGIFGALFLIALALPISGLIKTESFPPVDINFFNIDIKTKEGTRLEETNLVVEEVEKLLLTDPLIKNFVTSVGGGGVAQTGGALGEVGSSNSHTATITVNLIKKEERDLKSYEITSDYREKLTKIQNAEVTISELRGGPPQGAPIEVRIFGHDLKQAEEIAQDLRVMLSELGAIQIEDSVELGTGEFSVRPDIQKMTALGINSQQIAGGIRSAIFGREISKITREGDEIEIWTRYNWGVEDKPISISQIENLKFQNTAGNSIALKDFAEIHLGSSFLSINHRDSDRIVTLTSESGDRLPADIFTDLENRLKSYSLPENFRIEMGGENEEVERSFADLQQALIVAFVLIALILILQFNSFSQPFIILCSLPFSLIGVFFGFFVFGINLSIAAFIGIVSLAGIVVNDAIVLIDRINQNRKNGLDLKAAIREAGPARLQPILITSITTVFGILPLTLSDEFWLGLGSAIIFGITFSTLLTLLLVPVLYKMLEKRRRREVH